MPTSRSKIVPDCSLQRWLSRSRVSIVSAMLLMFVGGCDEETTAPTPADQSPEMAAAATTSSLVFRQVSGGSEHTCGVTSDNRAYCWGRNNEGQLGDGTLSNRT